MNRPKDTSHFLCSYEQIAQRINQIDPVRYDKTRNNLNGAVTWLSPFITHGIISTSDVANAVLNKHPSKKCYRLLYELAWREYFHRVWHGHADAIFSDMRSPSVSNCMQMPTAVLLITHGFMHNHARMWTAALCCNMADTHWLKAAQWMHYHLLDGDLASNTLSWQWVAGTFSHKRYIANQDNINKYSQYVQHGTFVDVSYEQLSEFKQPAQLADKRDATLPQSIPGNPVTHIAKLSGTVALRSIWQLDAQWREDADHHVLFIDKELHDIWPMSHNRWQFVLHWASFIPDLYIVSGTSENGLMAKNNRTQTNKNPEKQSKVCPVCKLSFNNRKRWESRGLWPSIVYCSQKCRRKAGEQPT